MKLEHLQLKNYRGFELLEFVPEPDVTVLVGVNGAGKSSVLDAFRIALQQIPRRVLGDDKRGNDLLVSDLRVGASEVSIEVRARIGTTEGSWSIRRPRVGEAQNSTHELAIALFDDLRVNEGLAVGRPRLPFAIHLASNRSVLDVPEAVRRHPDVEPISTQGVPAYEGALAAGPTDFRDFFGWYREEEDVYNERKLRGTSAPSLTSRPESLEIVRGAVQALFPSGENLRIERRPHQRMVIDVRGVPLDIGQLSDGEKSVLAMTGDIARRMVLADAVSDDPLAQEAVVLIDEIELHLHPGLQRTILPKLRRVFANTQLIVTTHSPQVLSSVHARNVRLLSNFQVVPLERETWRRDTNRILESVFDDPGRPPEIATKLNALRDAVDDDRFDDARRLIAELRADLDGDDPDVVFYEQLLPPIVDTAAQ